MGSLDDLETRLDATASQCPTFEDPTEEQLDLIRSTMTGSPHVYAGNWIAWGIPVIVVVSIVNIIIVVVVVINGNKNKSKYTPNQPPSAGSGPHDAAGPNPAAANSNAQGNNSISDGVFPDNPYPQINAINSNAEKHEAQPVQPSVENSNGFSQANPYPPINANLENHAAQPVQPFVEDIPLATPVNMVNQP
jgi:hypothetical protein